MASRLKNAAPTHIVAVRAVRLRGDNLHGLVENRNHQLDLRSTVSEDEVHPLPAVNAAKVPRRMTDHPRGLDLQHVAPSLVAGQVRAIADAEKLASEVGQALAVVAKALAAEVDHLAEKLDGLHDLVMTTERVLVSRLVLHLAVVAPAALVVDHPVVVADHLHLAEAAVAHLLSVAAVADHPRSVVVDLHSAEDVRRLVDHGHDLSQKRNLPRTRRNPRQRSLQTRRILTRVRLTRSQRRRNGQTTRRKPQIRKTAPNQVLQTFKLDPPLIRGFPA